MSHTKYIHRPTLIKDSVILIVFNLILFAFFLHYDLLETLYQFSRNHEHLELDEIIPLGISIAFSLLIFSYRRIKELGALAQSLEDLSLRDPLTHLYNRRAAQIELLSWCQGASASNQSFYVIFLDLDNFRNVNELFGQTIADDVLILVSKTLYKQTPDSARLYRWLDDRFIFLWPKSDSANTHQITSQLKNALQAQSFPSTLSISASTGCAVFQKGESIEELLHSAEDSLLDEKQNVSRYKTA